MNFLRILQLTPKWQRLEWWEYSVLHPGPDLPRQEKRRSESLLDYSPELLSSRLAMLIMAEKNDLACIINHITENLDGIKLSVLLLTIVLQ